MDTINETNSNQNADNQNSNTVLPNDVSDDRQSISSSGNVSDSNPQPLPQPSASVDQAQMQPTQLPRHHHSKQLSM